MGFLFYFFPFRRLRRYIGPQNYSSWADKTAKQKMEKDIQVIKAKAEQIYEKFKSYFVFQVKFGSDSYIIEL